MQNKRNRLVLIILLILMVVTYYAFSMFGSNVSESSIILNILGVLNVVLILILLILTLRSLIKQITYGKGQSFFKISLRAKLVAITVALVIIPSTVILVMGTSILYSVLNHWYQPELKQVLKGTKDVVESYQSNIIQDTSHYAKILSSEISYELLTVNKKKLPLFLKEKMEKYRLTSIEIYKNGSLKAFIKKENLPLGKLKPASKLKKNELTKGTGFYLIDKLPAGNYMRFGTIIPVGDTVQDRFFVVTGKFLTKEISEQMEFIIKNYEKYEKVKDSVKSLKNYNISSLLLIGIIAVFSGLWAGLKFTDYFLKVFNLLLEATENISKGNLEFGVEVTGGPEVTKLLNSFNDMVNRLRAHEQELKLRTIELESMNRYLEEKKHYFETVLNNIPVGIIAINNFGNIISINNFALEVLGQKHAVKEGTRMQFLLKGTKGKSALKDMIDEVLNTGEPSVIKTLTFETTAGIRTAEVVITLLKDPDETEIGYIITIEDVTELEKAQKMLAWKEAVRRIVHELKNPLTPIKLSAERIKVKAERNAENLREVVIESVKPMIEEINTMQLLIENFSKFAKMPPPKTEETNINDLLKDIIELLDSPENNVNFETILGESIPLTKVDKILMKSAFLNIIKNALAAMEEEHQGVLTIKTIYLASDRKITIEISDTGKGIPDEHKEKIFIPYFSTKPKGDGLGLAIVNSIITAHNGHIMVTDNFPKGSKFIISIPVV
jgi:two-component system nitrogen regulation sensor histidine kinase NtrY